MMNLVEAATGIIGGMRAAAAAPPDPTHGNARARLEASNPGVAMSQGSHPRMNEPPHATEVERVSRGVRGRRTYVITYAGKLMTPMPNMEDTRVFHYNVRAFPPGAYAEGNFYATADGRKVPKGRHWWLRTGRGMIGQESAARVRRRGYPTLTTRAPAPAPAPRRAARQPEPDPPELDYEGRPPPESLRAESPLPGTARMHGLYARARFYARGEGPARRHQARRYYSMAVEEAIRIGHDVPDPPAGLEERADERLVGQLPLREEADESVPGPANDGLAAGLAMLERAQSAYAAPAPQARRTALGAGAARAVQSSQLPPADAPDAAAFGLGPIAAANDESEREKLTSCAICLDEEKPRVALFAPCGHLAACLSCYHAACAADARNARTCPICKAEGRPVLLRLA